MSRLRQFVRLLVATQLLPALESGEEPTLIGGQAVLEGVMMRSPHAWGIAVRKTTGEMATHVEALQPPSEKHKWMGWPIVRGLVTLGFSMKLGFRALRYSTDVALEDFAEQQGQKKVEISGWLTALNLIIGLGFFIFMYKFVPLVAATGLRRLYPIFGNQLLFNLVDGAIRLLLFIGFLWLISRPRDIHRVFQYHGAEHKTVFCYEDGKPLVAAEAQRYSTFHPRCGTSFLMTVMLISILVYAVIPIAGGSAASAAHGLSHIFDRLFWTRFALRIALLPLIAGLSYEIIRFAARKRGSLFALMTRPGLWLQRITTQPPADDMVECAIAALQAAMELEKQRGGELVVA